MIKPEVDNMSDGKTPLIIRILNKKCADGFCENPKEKFYCKSCPLVKESQRRFGVDVINQ